MGWKEGSWENWGRLPRFRDSGAGGGGKGGSFREREGEGVARLHEVSEDGGRVAFKEHLTFALVNIKNRRRFFFGM